MRRLPEKYDPTAISQSTNDPLIADHRNFYKVEKWTKDGGHRYPNASGLSLAIAPSTRPRAMPRWLRVGSKTSGARLVFAWMKPPNAPACGNPNQVQSGIFR
jgi:hypothetical protein